MLKDDRDYMDSVYKRLDLLTRSKTYRDVDKDVAHLHRRIYRAAVFKLNHASRDPITHDQLMLEMFGMLTEDNMYLLAAKMDLPPVLEKPNALVRINNILMDIDNLSAVPGLPKVAVERLQDAKKSIVAVQEQIKAKPWTPMPLERRCYLNYDPAVGPTTCAIDEDDRDSDSRCPVIREARGCWGRSDCDYYCGSEEQMKKSLQLNDTVELNKTNTGSYSTESVWG
jgi:hypothetical protein